MKIAIIGLGKMGLNIAKRLSRSKISVIGFDKSHIPHDRLPVSHFELAKTLSDLVNDQPSPRIIWLMLPGGNETEQVINELTQYLDDDDLIVDGGNSNYHDTLRRGAMLAKKGYKFLDVGVSGGIWGLTDGYCLMIGGDAASVEVMVPVFNTLSANGSNGWSHLGDLGSGHFAKMIHNGIEYGMMQSLAEGLELAVSNNEFSIEIEKLTELWRHGSVVRSWLLDMICQGLKLNSNLDEILPLVPDSGEGRWFAIEAIERGVAIPVIAQALNVRFQSQSKLNYGNKILSIMRNAFGGHEIYKK